MRRRHPNGKSRSAHAIGMKRHFPGLFTEAIDVDVPVKIATATFPVVPGLNVSVAGLKTQLAFAGSEPHWNANVPADPLSGVNASA